MVDIHSVVDVQTESTDEDLSLPELVKKREAIELQLATLGTILDANHVDMRTSLVDAEGYPRPDIDVAQGKNMSSYAKQSKR